MNYIIFRQDGSVEQINLTDIIVQGDNLVDDIFIAVEGYTDSDFSCRAVVERPDGFVTTLTGVTATFEGYNGYKVTLTSVETQIAGEIKINFVLADGDTALWTYQIKLTVNKSGYLAEYTSISLAQYENLLTTLSTLQAKFAQPNVRGYINTCDDYSDLALGQLYLVEISGDLKFGKKTSGAESLTKLLKQSNDTAYNFTAYNVSIYGGTFNAITLTGNCSISSTTTHNLFVHNLRVSNSSGGIIHLTFVNKSSTAMTFSDIISQLTNDGHTTYAKSKGASGITPTGFTIFEAYESFNGSVYYIEGRYFDSTVKSYSFGSSSTIVDNITSL